MGFAYFSPVLVLEEVVNDPAQLCCVHEILSSAELYDLCSRLNEPDVFNWSLYEGGLYV